MSDFLDAFYRVLIQEIRKNRPEYLRSRFTVAEIYQNLVPYRTHRDLIGVEMNADYENTLLRLLAGEGDYLIIESDVARREIREELQLSNPNTGLFRDFAAADVRLTSAHEESLDEESGEDGTGGDGEDNSEDNTEDDETDDQETAVGDLVTDVGEDPTSEGEGPVGGSDSDVCQWCRAELPRRSVLNFCPFCGSDLRLTPCGECGEELDPAWRFCPGCGTESER